MRIEAIAKVDMSQNNGATARLRDFCRHLAQENEVRLWLQKTEMPQELRQTENLQVRLLSSPTLAARHDVIRGLRAIGYEAALLVRLLGAFGKGGRADAIYLREVATIVPGLISHFLRVPLFIEIDGFPYRDARRRPGLPQRIRAAILRWQGRLCAGIITFSDGQAQVMQASMVYRLSASLRFRTALTWTDSGHPIPRRRAERSDWTRVWSTWHGPVRCAPTRTYRRSSRPSRR